ASAADAADADANVNADATVPVPGGEAIDGARRVLRRAGGVLRSASERISQQGGIEVVGDGLARAGAQLERAESALATVTAIEGTVVESSAPADAADAGEQPIAAVAPAAVAPAAPAPRRDRFPGWLVAGVVAAAATYGALKLQGPPPAPTPAP